METSPSMDVTTEKHPRPASTRGAERREQRAHRRSAVPLGVQFRTRARAAKSRERSGTLLHWSPKGGRLEMPHALERGEWLDLRFPRSSAVHLPDGFPAN